MTKEAPSLREVTELEFVVEHTIQSPPERIFEAYTQPDLITQWWAQPGKTMRIETMDVRPGGKWRFTHRGGGQEMMMHGEYREVKPVTRLSYTYNLGEGQAQEILAIVDLRAVQEGTRITLTNRCSSRQQLDTMLQHGAKAGAMAALKALEAVLRRSGA